VTTTVSFHFTSPQFVILSAAVTFMKGARIFSDGEFRSGRITNGSIEGVLIEGPIEFDAMLSQLTVTRRDDGRKFDIPFLPTSGVILPQEISICRVAVELDLRVVVVIRVEDTAGAAVPGAIVSASIPATSATFEWPVNQRGEVAVLGTPGHHSFRLVSVGERWLGSEKIRAEIEVKPNDRGERYLVLRVPDAS